jgi:hypothetical protein
MVQCRSIGGPVVWVSVLMSRRSQSSATEKPRWHDAIAEVWLEVGDRLRLDADGMRRILELPGQLKDASQAGVMDVTGGASGAPRTSTCRSTT